MTPILSSERLTLFFTLVGPFAADHNQQRFEKNFEIVQKRSIADVLQIHPDHFIKSRAAAPLDLPNPGDSRFDAEDPAAMPELVTLKFVAEGRARSNQGHFPRENVDELRQLVETGDPEKVSEGCDPRIIPDLVNALGIRRIAANEILDELLMNVRIGLHIHGAEFQERKLRSSFS